ncbi:MAG: VOC family protein [Planctomycetes bacterium]|nr:VOC family protein [Planctomycetota bacterium]
MANDIAHFAIHADDCERAQRFYGQVFGWTFEPWGPPGFWRIHTSPTGIHGALHARREPLSGQGMRGFECTIGVDDVGAIAAAVAQHGGKVTLQPFLIETVGTLIMFEDTEGNVVGAMQYLDGVR